MAHRDIGNAPVFAFMAGMAAVTSDLAVDASVRLLSTTLAVLCTVYAAACFFWSVQSWKGVVANWVLAAISAIGLVGCFTVRLDADPSGLGGLVRALVGLFFFISFLGCTRRGYLILHPERYRGPVR